MIIDTMKPVLIKPSIKAGFYLNLSEISGSLKRDLKGKKVMKHHQTVERPRNGTPGWWTTVSCASTNFATSNYNFKTAPNLPNFLFS